MHRAFKLTVLVLFFIFALFSSVTMSQPVAAEAQKMKAEAEKMQQQMEKMRQEAEQRQEEMLERLKTTDPEAYKQQKTRLEQQKKISEILEAFYEKKLDAASAESRLYPLIKAQTEEELAGIDSRIDRARKQLEELENIKANPETLVKKRLDQLLGRMKPGERGLPEAGLP